MAFSVTYGNSNGLTTGQRANVDHVNANFQNIVDELNAFPTNAVLAAGIADGITLEVSGNALRIKDGGISSAKCAATFLDTDGTLTANSDTRVASQKAIKTYVAANQSPLGTSYYDSGWFAVENNKRYTKSHGLGSAPDVVLAYIAENADGTGKRASANGSNSQGFDGTGGAGYQSRSTDICLVTASQVKIRTGISSVCCTMDENGSLWTPTSAYARIIAFTLNS